MDFGNNAETPENQDQPLADVASGDEANEIQPQDSDTDQEELFVDVEGDQEKPKSRMTQEQAYAAWKKSESKRKAKNKVIEDQNRRIEQLEDMVAKTARGAKPTLEGCNDDPEVYEQRLNEWYENAPKAPAQKPKETQQPAQANNDAADFYLYHKEQELASKLPDYESVKSQVADTLQAYAPGADASQIIQGMSSVCQQAGIDVSKAIYAMGKVDGLVAELNQAANTGNQFAVAEVLRKAEGKIKVREKKPIDSTPETEIAGSGPIDAVHKEIENARKVYAEAPTLKNHKKLLAAKAKLKK